MCLGVGLLSRRRLCVQALPLLSSRVRRVLVTDPKAGCIGVLSQSDVLRTVVESLDAMDEISQLPLSVAVKHKGLLTCSPDTPAAIAFKVPSIPFPCCTLVCSRCSHCLHCMRGERSCDGRTGGFFDFRSPSRGHVTCRGIRYLHHYGNHDCRHCLPCAHSSLRVE